MKIAFATDDRVTISKHTGRAKEFVIYELSAYEVISKIYIENVHLEHDQSEDNNTHSHKDIVEKIKDADYLYLRHLGKNLKRDLEEADLIYEFTDEHEIESVIKDFFEEDSA